MRQRKTLKTRRKQQKLEEEEEESRSSSSSINWDPHQLLMDHCQERRRPPEVKGHWGLKKNLIWKTLSSRRLLTLSAASSSSSSIQFLFSFILLFSLLLPPFSFCLFFHRITSVRKWRVVSIWKCVVHLFTVEPGSRSSRAADRTITSSIQHHWRTQCLIQHDQPDQEQEHQDLLNRSWNTDAAVIKRDEKSVTTNNIRCSDVTHYSLHTQTEKTER